MSLYLDTSAVVAALVPEAASERVAGWLRANEGEGLTISPWVEVEVSSALSLKLRTGALTDELRVEALAHWRRWRDAALRSVAVPDEAFRMAAELAARHELGLRGGDALHLAIAAQAGCTLVTLDARMAKAAPEAGVPVAEV